MKAKAKTKTKVSGKRDKAQLDAVFSLLWIAQGDMENYLQDGNPHTDYGNEWPASARLKAQHCELAAEFLASISKLYRSQGYYKPQVQDLRSLAKAYRQSAKEYEAEYSSGEQESE